MPENFTAQPTAIVVSYDANGGTNAPDMQSVDRSGSTIVLGDAPTRNGYTFLGYLDKNTGTLYQPGNVYTVTENVQFVAQWQ